MVSSSRRKLRRYLLGATQKAVRMWWIGQITVRVMSVSRVTTTRTVRVKAHCEAEKSRQIRRRKRGLRINRDRGNADPIIRQPLPKSSNARVINHIGRKFIWAVRSSNDLVRDCERFNKFPRGVLQVSHPAYRARRNMKFYCLAKWQRYRDRAVSMSVPLVTCFHDSFWKFLLVMTSRGRDAADWDMLLVSVEPETLRPSLPPPYSPSRLTQRMRVQLDSYDMRRIRRRVQREDDSGPVRGSSSSSRGSRGVPRGRATHASNSELASRIRGLF